MNFLQLLDGAEILEESGNPPVAGLDYDSRRVKPGWCFVAMRGDSTDGNRFIDQAFANGAVAVVSDSVAPREGIAWAVVPHGRRALARLSANFYRHPAEKLTITGITGTNGKTTTSFILSRMLRAAGRKLALLGTVEYRIGNETLPAPHTTPEALELNQVFSKAVNVGCTEAVLEVSSHALEQQRVFGIPFEVAVFTNLTRDHLDYHGTMDAYLAAKASLVPQLSHDGVAVVNDDDRAWDALPVAPRRVTFGVTSTRADVRAERLEFDSAGSTWRLTTKDASADVHLSLMGDFNVANALGAAAAAFALGMPVPIIAHRLDTQPQVPGRLEIVGARPTVLRDYAHTPDALERALAALRPFTPGALIAVFGAGGDRDRGKRPLMGQVAARLADRVIITSDNPRTEDPERILDDIAAALTPGHFERIEDRRAAIEYAIATADPALDVVLLAGKGHEDYQVRGTTKYPFDEKEIVGAILAAARTKVNAR